MAFLSDEFIIEKLNTLNEHKMAKEIFVPLLRKKGLRGVKFTGGTDEQGIDIEYYELSCADNSKQYAGIQFKKGDISYSSRGKNGTVKEIKNQAEEAFGKDICEVNSGGVNHISRFIVATTGDINENARKFINRAKNRGEQTNISYWDSNRLSDYIRENFIDEFMVYFELDEDGDYQEVESDDDYIVNENYIYENYVQLIDECKRCIKMFSSSQRRIVEAVVNYYFENDSCGIVIGDLLYFLETQEESIKDDLIDLQRIDCIDIDDDRRITLSGRANSLIKLAINIIEEMIGADELNGNEEKAKDIFSNLVL